MINRAKIEAKMKQVDLNFEQQKVAETGKEPTNLSNCDSALLLTSDKSGLMSNRDVTSQSQSKLSPP